MPPVIDPDSGDEKTFEEAYAERLSELVAVAEGGEGEALAAVVAEPVAEPSWRE